MSGVIVVGGGGRLRRGLRVWGRLGADANFEMSQRLLAAEEDAEGLKFQTVALVRGSTWTWWPARR